MISRIEGWLGERLKVNIYNWLFPAPTANPGLTEAFLYRDRQPRSKLVPWYGEFPGKYLTAAAASYAVKPDPVVRFAAEGVIKRLRRAVTKDGLLSPHPTAEAFQGNATGWDGDPLMTPLWDLWGYYHLFYGLVRWHQAAGDAEAFAFAKQIADVAARAFLSGAASMEAARAPENMGAAHGYAILYQLTGEEDYRRMRNLILDFADEKYKLVSGMLDENFDYYQLPWPRWELLHAVQALKVRWDTDGDERSRAAFLRIVESILRTDRHDSGGFSSGERARGNPYDLQPIETCCSVAWLAVLGDAYDLTGESRYFDEMELTLFNAILGAQHPSGRWWTYDTPMNGVRRASAHTIVFQSFQGSPELNCCSVNGPRALGETLKRGLLCEGETVTVNQYGPGAWTFAGLTVAQSTAYPAEDEIDIALSPDKPRRLTVRLRIPCWSKHTRVSVGQTAYEAAPGAYCEIAREWRAGDTIRLRLDFSLTGWAGEEELRGRTALYRGPILLAYDQRFNETEPEDAAPLGTVLETITEKDDFMPPFVLLREAQTGYMLCDFASAGAVGTRYVSWLPLRGEVRPSPWKPSVV